MKPLTALPTDVTSTRSPVMDEVREFIDSGERYAQLDEESSTAKYRAAYINREVRKYELPVRAFSRSNVVYLERTDHE